MWRSGMNSYGEGKMAESFIAQLFADHIIQLSAGYVLPSSPTTVVL